MVTLCLGCWLDDIESVARNQILRVQSLLLKRSDGSLRSVLHRFRLTEEARAGELAAEILLSHCVLALARRQEWPEIGLQGHGHHPVVLRTRAHWERFAATETPLMLVCAIAALWPDFAGHDDAELP